MRKYITSSTTRRGHHLPAFLLLAVLLPGLFTGSCVKTNPNYTNFSDLHPIAEFYLGGPAINTAYIAAQSTPTDYTIDVNLPSPDPASQPIPLPLSPHTAPLKRTNTSGGAIATLIPE